MRHLLILIFILGGHLTWDVGLLAQSGTPDTVKVFLVVDTKPMPGANFIIKGTKMGTVSDQNGLAILVVPSGNDKVVVSIIGPYIELSILRPVDSIYFDVDSREATYYYHR